MPNAWVTQYKKFIYKNFIYKKKYIDYIYIYIND